MNRKAATGLVAVGTTVVLALFALVSTAETRYVAPGGSSTSACTLAAPCTLTRAAALSGPGDVIQARGGVYSGTKTSLTLNGSSGQPIIVESYPGETAVFDSTGVAMGDTDATLKCNACTYVTFRNFTIQNSGARGLSFSGDNPTKSHHITIDGVTVLHVGQRAIGGSGDDVTITRVYVEYAAEDNTTGGVGGGWAGGISSYTLGDGSPSHRWSLTDSHIAYVHGECVIALRVIGWIAERNTFSNCYNVYTDKASQVVWSGNTIVQQPGWGKYGGVGDGFKLANENPQLNPLLQILNVSLVDNHIIGAKDCFSYWQAAGTYAGVIVTGNSCDSATGSLAQFNAVPATQPQPVGNIWRGNTCTGACSTYFGDTTDRAGWTLELGTTATPARTATQTRSATWTSQPSLTATRSSTPSPSTTSTSTATSTPSQTVTRSPTFTATASPSPSATHTPTPTPTPVLARNNLGVLVANWNATGVGVANTLGVGLARTTIFADRWDGTCIECDRIIAGGLKLVLTIRANGGAGVATVFPPDIAEYVLDVRSILARYGPWIEVLVAENEENSILFWASPVQEYHELLAMLCREAHAAGVKCANGGLVYSLTALLTWQAYKDALYDGEACSFAWRNFDADLAAQMCGDMPDNTADYILEQVTKGRTLLAGYKESGADVMNFHSYAPDYYSNIEMAAYLYHAFGLRVMIGELGERELRPTNVISELQACADASTAVDYCIWFSVDINQAKALANADGTLRPTGDAFRAWVVAK